MGKKDICGGCGEKEKHCCCEQEARNAAGNFFFLGVAIFCFGMIFLKIFGIL